MTVTAEDTIPIPWAVPEYDGATPNPGSLKATLQNLQRQITALGSGGNDPIIPNPLGKEGWVLSNDGVNPVWVPLEAKNLQTDFNAVGDGVTDDTAAVQAAINYGENNNGLLCFVPAGRYLIAGALQDTGAGGGNAQLLFPHIPYSERQITYCFFSNWPVPTQPAVIPTDLPAPTSGAIFVTNNTQGTGFQPSMWGTVNGATVSPVIPFTNINLVFRNIRFVSYDDPNILPLNLAIIGNAVLDGVCVDTDEWHTPDITEPSHVDAYGVVMPVNNNGARSRITELIVIGYMVGLRINEHCVIDEASAWGCVKGFEVGPSYHGWTAGRLMAIDCRINMSWTATGASGLLYARGVVMQLDIEHAITGWASTDQIDIQDPSNVGYGTILSIAIVQANYGNLNVAIVSGGANLILNVF
jgi:hypothetical protein